MPVDLDGSRHYHLGGAQTAWTCPACGAEQLGLLHDGCTACGRGKPGRHVGETPENPGWLNGKGPTGTSTSSTGSTSTPLSTSAIDLPTFLRDGFARWLDAQAEEKPSYLSAFVAGYEFAMNLPLPPKAKPEPPTFTADGQQARTLAAALSLFLDQVLVRAEEEIASGEWLSLEEARALLTQLQEEGLR